MLNGFPGAQCPSCAEGCMEKARKLEKKEEFCLPFCRKKVLSLRDLETNPG